MESYREFVDRFVANLREARELPACDVCVGHPEPVAGRGPKVLIFSPHPDDECIVGGLALRLQRESDATVSNVAVTLGSKAERQAGRLQELRGACGRLRFGLIETVEGGLGQITVKGRAEDPDNWAAARRRIAEILQQEQPAIVFVPHDQDWHPTHIGTHHLVVDALTDLDGFSCAVVETEFWQAMATPNLMVELNAGQTASLIEALTCHVGEIARNPYHLGLPSWLNDNVRRGGEVVGGQGTAAPDCDFACLYRLRQWRDGALHEVFDGGRFLGGGTDPLSLFP